VESAKVDILCGGSMWH